MTTISAWTCRSLLLFSMILLMPSPVKGEDWPMFGRDGTRNAVSPERRSPTNWDIGTEDDSKPPQRIQKAQRNVKWSVRLGTTTYGDPVVSNGMIWIGTNNGYPSEDRGHVDASVLACFRECDGKLLYRYVSPRMPQGRVHDWPYASMACSPLVENDRIWFVTNRAEVVCLDITSLRREGSDPEPLWKVDLIREFGVFPRGSIMHVSHLCSIATYKEYIYVITGTGVDDAGVKVPNPDAPSLICFNKNTGKAVWTDSSPGANLLLGQWSSPTIIEINGRAQCVTPQGDGWVRSFDALSGKLLWQFDMNRKNARWVHRRRGSRFDVLASPVFVENRIYIGSGMHPTWDTGRAGRLVCIDPTKQGDISAELAVDAKAKVILHRRTQAIDGALGETAVPNPNSGLVWEFTGVADGKKFSDVMHGTVSNVAVQNGLVIAVDFAGVLHCLDSKTGKHYWSQETYTHCHGSPLIVEDKVYLGTEDGRIIIVGLSSDPETALRKVNGGFEPLHEVEMDTAVYCSPIFANGVLYVATRTSLFAIASRNGEDALKPSPAVPPADSSSANKTRDPAPSAVFVPTPQDTVESMLELANLNKADVVYDLGSGDGRIVITAAKKYGCRAVGYESDKELVALSRAKADAAGVKPQVTFELSDLFDGDFRDADVIALYLLPRQLERLLPQLEKLKPGARIVSHQFGIPGVTPDRVVKVKSAEDSAEHTLYLWTVPLKRERE